MITLIPHIHFRKMLTTYANKPFVLMTHLHFIRIQVGMIMGSPIGVANVIWRRIDYMPLSNFVGLTVMVSVRITKLLRSSTIPTLN